MMGGDFGGEIDMIQALASDPVPADLLSGPSPQNSMRILYHDRHLFGIPARQGKKMSSSELHIPSTHPDPNTPSPPSSSRSPNTCLTGFLTHRHPPDP